MGRQLRRVPLDFTWPIDKVWKGFINPHYKHCHKCETCDGSGYNPATKQISDDWYDFADTGRKWCHDLTAVEVQALIDGERLWDLTKTWDSEQSKWVRKDPMPVVDDAFVKTVNEWSRHGFGHDSINHFICVEARAKAMGVYGLCPVCNGEGSVWDSPEDKQATEDWKEEEPPTGPGYQMWETVSEGSPISPVFETPEELAQYLADHPWGAGEATYGQWLRMIKGDGWAPSAVATSENGVMDGVEGIDTLQQYDGKCPACHAVLGERYETASFCPECGVELKS